MSESQISAFRDAVLVALHRAPERRLLGAQLGLSVQSSIGQTARDHGFANLADFVRRNLADEVSVQVGAQDVVFQLTTPGSAIALTLASSGASALPEPPPLQPDLRKVWKAPTGPFSLRVRVTDGDVRAAGREVPPAEGEVVLTSPSEEQHKAIARRFLDDHLPGEQRQAFETILVSRRAWWLDWDRLFRETAPRLRVEWLRFREKHLMELLDRALREAGLNDEAHRAALDIVERSRPAPRKLDSAPAGRPSEGLRAALLATVQGLSEEELRRVWVPAGLLADALLRGR